MLGVFLMFVGLSYVSHTFGRLEISINVSRKTSGTLLSHHLFSPCSDVVGSLWICL
jgi:hypothetical protein